MFKDKEIESCIPELKKYANYLTKHSYVSEDLVQETILKALSRRPLYKDGGKLIKWLTLIMKRIHLDQLKREKYFCEAIEIINWYDDINIFEINRKKLRSVIVNSNRKITQPIYLLSFFEMKYKEIAEILNEPENKMRRNVHEFRAYMRNNYKMEDFII